MGLMLGSHNLNKFAINVKGDGTELTGEVKTKLNNNPTVTIPKGETTFDDLKSESRHSTGYYVIVRIDGFDDVSYTY